MNENKIIMKWNKVKDGLPKKSDFYIAFDPDEMEDPQEAVMSVYFDLDAGFCLSDDNGNVYAFPNVTHWMPLPRYPED